MLSVGRVDIKRRKIIKRLFFLALVLFLAVFLPSTTAANAQKTVVYTWPLAEIGQGLWGGGPLYSDGTTAGNPPISLENGQVILQLHPTSWSPAGLDMVDLCFDVRIVKESLGLPPSFCFSDLGILLPVTGHGLPFIIPIPIKTILTVLSGFPS